MIIINTTTTFCYVASLAYSLLGPLFVPLSILEYRGTSPKVFITKTAVHNNNFGDAGALTEKQGAAAAAVAAVPLIYLLRVVKTVVVNTQQADSGHKTAVFRDSAPPACCGTFLSTILQQDSKHKYDE